MARHRELGALLPRGPGTLCSPHESFRTTIADTTGLASGEYTFVAKAEDGAGNVGESQPWTITVDRSLNGEEGDASADQREWDEDLTDYGTPAAPVPVSPSGPVAPGSYTTETWDPKWPSSGGPSSAPAANVAGGVDFAELDHVELFCNRTASTPI